MSEFIAYHIYGRRVYIVTLTLKDEASNIAKEYIIIEVVKPLSGSK